MSTATDRIDDELRGWIGQQRLFFVATAPLAATGHVNVSPKGLDTLRVLDDRTLAYLDFTGSGVETIAHLRDNGRIVLMLCAFDGPPRIVRFHGRGEVLAPADPEFADLAPLFDQPEKARSIVRVQVQRVARSCGFGVPLMSFVADRPTLGQWHDEKGVEGAHAYQRQKNAKGLDDLPGVDWLDGQPGDRTGDTPMITTGGLIAPRTARCLELRPGDRLAVTDVDGGQVADLVAFARHDPTEWLSNGRTFDYLGHLCPRLGDVLYSNRGRAMWTIEEDRVGQHDFLIAACSREMFARQYDDPHGIPNCHDNLTAALANHGLGSIALPTPLNLFMHTRVHDGARIEVLPAASKPGDHVTLRAEMPLLVAISACSAPGCNGGSFGPIGIEIHRA